jgi:amino acid transporter
MSEQQSAAAPAGGEKHRFGTFGGVFTPSILTILGVIMFMRTNFVVGYAGVWQALVILVICKSITFLTTLSISAIATNMEVRGGGSYYLISRVLGPEFGGAIGLAYFCALALSVPFYVLGFTEAFCRSIETYPAFANVSEHFQLIAFLTAGVLFAVAYVGAGWAIRTQYVIMFFLFLAILAFTAGSALIFDLDRFRENWDPALPEYIRDHGLPVLGFWAIFAIYFPAVTGVDAGINMSGDLKDPARSIPRGALAALGVGLAVYASQILLGGGAYPRYGDPGLIEKPYQLLQEHALGGAAVGGVAVMLGVFAATLSSALGSYLGGPRVLQAVSRDPILSVLRPFGKGSTVGDEPRRALILVGVITAGVLLWAGNESGGAALNVVASVVTMFFLYSYGMMNLAAFVEAYGRNPSFRPRFRYFHWATALLGAAACVAVSFVINAAAAAGAVAVIAFLFWYVRRQQLKATFGDARRGFVYARVRKNLLRLQEMPEDPRNWRPNILVFSGNPETRGALVNYAVWMEAGYGFVILSNVIVGEYDDLAWHRDAAVRYLEEFCREQSIRAFPMVVVAEELDDGLEMILQTAGIGPVRPNLVVMGWPEKAERAVCYARHLRAARHMKMGLVLLRERGRAVPYHGKRIDLWWRGQKNGGVMLLLAYMLTCNWQWSGFTIRVLRVVRNEEGRRPAREALAKLVGGARVEAEVKVVVAEEPFEQVLRQYSADATCVLLGCEVPPEGEGREEEWFARLEEMQEGLPTTLLVSSAFDSEELLEG